MENISTRNNLRLLLDSNLIIATILQTYDIKLVDCGDYTQVYLYEQTKTRKAKNVKNDDLSLKKIDINGNGASDAEKSPQALRNDNIIRSKLECQRLAKANMGDWATFITLTFADNITDINQALKKYHSFITKVQSIKKDFKYICVPEFQKRGAVHFHLLTNIGINETSLIYAQEGKEKYKHIKYWSHGFTKVDTLNNDVKKVIGYISKYMTKDIDERLFNHRRYYFSRNLRRPKENFISLDSERDVEFFNKKIQEGNLIYENNYINPYDNQKVTFLEYLSHTT